MAGDSNFVGRTDGAGLAWTGSLAAKLRGVGFFLAASFALTQIPSAAMPMSTRANPVSTHSKGRELLPEAPHDRLRFLPNE